MNDKRRAALEAARTFLASLDATGTHEELDVCLLQDAWNHPPLTLGTVRTLAEMAEPSRACNRCGASPAPYQAREVCFDCDPGTPLCRACFLLHCREVLAEAKAEREAAGPQEGIPFQQPDYRAEKLQMAADMVAAYGKESPS